MEFVYIISTKQYSNDDIYKIGYTGDLQARLSNFNCGRIKEDEMILFFSLQCREANLLEKRLKDRLKNYNHCKEFFKLELKNLIQIFKEELELLEEEQCLSFENLNYQGKTIKKMKSDGYINLTDLFKVSTHKTLSSFLSKTNGFTDKARIYSNNLGSWGNNIAALQVASYISHSLSTWVLEECFSYDSSVKIPDINTLKIN